MKKLLSLLVIVVVLVAPTLTVLAQNGDNPICQGLSAADCQELLAAQSAMAMVTSVAMPSWEISFTLNVPAMEPGQAPVAIDFAARGSGALSMDMAADVIINLVIDEATITDGAETQSGSAQLIITPTMGYILWEGQWYGGEITDGDLPAADDLAMLGELTNLNESLAMMGLDLTGVINTTRAGDVFTSTVNITGLVMALLQSPMLGGMLGDMMGDDMGGMEMDQETIGMLAMFLPALLGSSSLTTTTGIAGGYQNMLGLDLVIDMDLSLFGLGAIQGNVHFMTTMADYNMPVMADIPAEYLPIEELDAQIGELGDIGDMGGGLGELF